MISEIIEKWIKGILIDGITGNLSGLFDNVNAKVGEIASDVGSTPQAWNSGMQFRRRRCSRFSNTLRTLKRAAVRWEVKNLERIAGKSQSHPDHDP